jgi:Putative MetA-pathway of phenol degradation
MSFVPMGSSRGARYLPVAAVLLSLFNFATSGRAAEGNKPSPTADDNLYETDRPGELENPFALPPGKAQLVSYVVALNAAAREDDFDTNASAVFLDTAVRFGVADRIEGVLAIDTFLQANVPPRRGGGATSGLGYATLFAKWNFLADPKGEDGIAITPFVRLPLQRSIGGTSRSESGLIVPFEADLEGGWELQGSTGVSRAPEGRSRSTQYQSQVELDRTLTRKLTVYLELELEAGEGQPHWATELGVTCQLTTTLQIDVGTSLGLGRISRGREGYAGLGWRL